MALQVRTLRKMVLVVALLFLYWQCTNVLAQAVSRRSPVVEVVERVGPSIVNVSTSRISGGSYPEYDEFFGPPTPTYKTQSLGSGLIVAEEGFIVTNYHVIRRASQIMVTLHNQKDYLANLIAADPENDLALLKIEPDEPLASIVWAHSSEILIGETAIALGNPFGLQNSVTTGVVSATNRTIALDGNITFHDFIQTDAAINPGNSGGALVNIYGEIMGINTAIYSKGQGLGFAIPSSRVRMTIGRLLEYHPSRGIWLGLEVEETERDKANWSVQVVYVTADSPASKGGVKPRDTIVSVDGTPVNCMFDFKRKMYLKEAGESVTLRLRSEKGDVREVRLTVAALPHQLRYHQLWSKTGIAAANETKGVVVKSVRKNSSAERIGMQEGDIIISMGGYSIDTVETLNNLIQQMEEGQALSVILMREGKKLGGRLIVE